MICKVLVQKQLQALQVRAENISNQLESQNTNSLTKHDITGNTLQVGIHSYMADTYSADLIAAQSSDIVYYRRPSYGTFSTAIQVAYSFGQPVNLQFAGVVMDVDRLAQNTEHKPNCYDDWLNFFKASGMRSSAYEHEIPEELLGTVDDMVQAVSTAKALSVAIAQGQRIYTLTQDNADQLVNITIDDVSRAEITEALTRGLEVTVHQSPITIDGWVGSGYRILDIEYGSGVYKIAGGLSGGATNSESAKENAVTGLLDILELAKRKPLELRQLKPIDLINKLSGILLKKGIFKGIAGGSEIALNNIEASGCLTENQTDAFIEGIVTLTKLHKIPRLTPVGFGITVLGSFLGLLVMVAMIVNIIAINVAVGDCRFEDINQ